MILAIFFVSLLAISAVSAADNATSDVVGVEKTTDEVVSVENDENGNILKKTNEENNALTQANNTETDSQILSGGEGTYNDLRDEIGSGGDINLTKSYYLYDGGDTIVIANPGVINGNGAVIDMNNSVRAFNVESSGVTFKNLTIKNANNRDSGGAIYFNTATVLGTVENCNFINNTVSYDGSGGAIYFERHGTVLNCNFVNNKVNDRDSNGGAIYMYAGTVENCNFTNNFAKNAGGAIWFISMGNVTNCNFTNNAATYGGAIDFDGADNVVENCNFIGNSAYDGGAIYQDKNGIVENCNFVNNKVYDISGSSGAAIFMFTGTVSNCNFTNNSAEYAGGAIWFMSRGNVTNCNFTNNAAVYGGAIEFYKGLGTVSNCNFIDNIASHNGGAIYSKYDCIVENCNFTNNFADEGGALDIEEACVVLNCNFTNNVASELGGAVIINRYDGELTDCKLTNCTFINNSVTHAGGAIYISAGIVENCNFTNNSAEYAGGAIYFDDSGHVTNCNFTGNIASTGSAIYFFHMYDSHVLSIFDSSFLNNRADAYDDAISIEKDGNKIKIIFRGRNNLLNAICSRDNAEVSFTNVTYWGADGITNTGKDTTKPSRSDKEAGQNITFTVFVNDIIVLIPTKVTDKNGEVVLNIPEGDYIVTARHYEDSYYTLAEKTISNMTFTVNVTSQATTNRTVNITANSDIYSERVAGKLQFILPNGDKIDADYGGDGLWWAEHTFDNFTTYQVNATYDGLDNVNVSNAIITITRADSKITLDNITLEYGEIRNVTVETVGAAKITASINGANVTVLNNFTIQISDLSIGNYTLTVTTVPDYDHNPVTKTAKITVNIAHTEITVDSPTVDIKVFDEVPSGAALTPADAGNLTYKSSNETVVIVKDGKIKALGKGTATVTVSFAGNENYTAAKNMTITVNVDLVDASVSVNNSTLDLVADDNFTIVATTDPAGLNVTFVPDNSGVVSVDENGVVTALKGGTATISVKVGGDGVYVENSTTVTVTVSKIPTEIKINRPSREMYVGVIGHVAAELIPSKAGNLTYVSNDTGVVSVSSAGVINANGAGTALITVSFNGTDKYAASSSSVNVLVNKAPAGIGANDLKLTVGDKSKLVYVLVPENAQGNISFVSSNPSVANVSSTGEVTAVSVGTANVTITFSGNKNYEKSNKTVKVKVDMANSTLSIGPSVLDYGNSLNITAYTTGAKGITAKINNVDAKVDGFTIEIPVMDVGNYTLTVTTIPDDNHSSVTKTATITVNKATTEIIIGNATLSVKALDLISAGASLTPADAGNLTYTSSNSSIAVVENGKIKALTNGTAVITVSFPGNENYTAAENKTINVTVTLKDAIISVNNSTLNLFVDDNFTIVATTNPDGLKVTFVQDDSGVYTVDENGNVTALKEGTGHILVKVGGDGVYAENTTEITVSVSKIPTEITLTNETLDLKVNEIVYGLANLTPANAGNLTFTSSDEDIVFVADGVILARGKGSANVTVSFAGNDKYAAALNRTIHVNVSLKDASVSVENDTLELKVDERYDLNATAVPSFLNVEYVSSNGSVATVTDYGIVTAVGEGTTTITLTVGNDVTYAVNTTNVTVTVSKIPTEITVDTTPLDLFVGDETVIVANLTPAGAGNVTFTSSDYDVVDFDYEGNVIAQGKGQAIITVSFAGDNKYAAAENKTIIINVSLDNASATVDNNTLDLKVGETSAINATKHPDTIMLDITYTSSNNSVVTVDKKGIVTAVGEGTAVITVEVGDDEIYAKNSTTVNVTVSKVSTEIESSAVTTVYNVDKNL